MACSRLPWISNRSQTSSYSSGPSYLVKSQVSSRLDSTLCFPSHYNSNHFSNSFYCSWNCIRSFLDSNILHLIFTTHLKETLDQPEFLLRNKTSRRQISRNMVFREMEIKTMRYHLTPIRMAIIKKCTHNKCWWACGEKGTPVHCWWECRLMQPLRKTLWRFLKKLKLELPSEKATATHSRVLAWRIAGTAEPVLLPSMGLHRVGHDWTDLTAAAATELPYDPSVPLLGWVYIQRKWKH